MDGSSCAEPVRPSQVKTQCLKSRSHPRVCIGVRLSTGQSWVIFNVYYSFLRDYADLCQATAQTTHLELEQADINSLTDGNRGRHGAQGSAGRHDDQTGNGMDQGDQPTGSRPSRFTFPSFAVTDRVIPSSPR